MKQKIMLKCTVCKNRNYISSKNKQAENKLKLNKYCSHCQKHTEHEETTKLK